MNPAPIEKIVEKALDKFPSDKVYEDLFQSGLRKAGEALETVLEFGSTILLPLKLASGMSKLYLKNALVRYEEKLAGSQNTITKVPPFVGLPVLEKLAVINQKDLSEAFLNLLTKASFEETVHLVHPSFIEVLNNLSSDEANLLFQLKNEWTMPFLDIESHWNPKQKDSRQPGHTRNHLKNLTGWENKFELEYPQNISLYIENLSRNGIIQIERRGEIQGFLNEYISLEREIYVKEIEALKKEIEIESLTSDFDGHLHVKRYHIEITNFGSSFMEACIDYSKSSS